MKNEDNFNPLYLLKLKNDFSPSVSGAEAPEMAGGLECCFGVMYYRPASFCVAPYSSYAPFLSASPKPYLTPFFALSSLPFSTFYLVFLCC